MSISVVAIGHAGIEFIGSRVDMAVRLSFIPGHGSIGVATSYKQMVLSVRYYQVMDRPCTLDGALGGNS